MYSLKKNHLIKIYESLLGLIHARAILIHTKELKYKNCIGHPKRSLMHSVKNESRACD